MKFGKLVFGAALAAALFAAACGSDGSSGATCGNGDLETGEQCDDGNTISGDGCSSACRTEIAGGECGDGVVDDGEECDDGGTDPGDGCDADCQDEVPDPVCGDGNLDVGEECDDGGTEPGDGCDEQCNDEVPPGDCGDGDRGPDEECDDGNNEDGDGCASDCTREEVAPTCGDGVVDEGEECDDGNTDDGDGCDSTCAREPGDCGDGVLNAGEQCDDGNTDDGDGCDSTCALEGAVCGDGVVDAGEQCDDSNREDGDGCSAGCRLELCGDGVIQPAKEECDDTNTISGDGCDEFCQLEGAEPECGNGVLEMGEQCDDGNPVSGDGCSAFCALELPGTCSADFELRCGDVDSWDTTFEGATDQVDAYSCVEWEESGPEYTYTFVASTASAVSIELLGLESDLDVFVIDADAGVCDPANCSGFGDNLAEFTSEPGKTYYVVVDGYVGASGAYSLQITCGACGDGAVDEGEECDDGNTDDGDGCSADCVLEACGDGTVDEGEECDVGDNEDCDGCSAACTVEECGNFTVDCGEDCDDGNTDDGDGCSAVCAFEGGACLDDFDLSCGDADSYSTSFDGSTDEIDFYSCVSWDESGPEYTYAFVAPEAGDVTVSLTGLSVDLDLFVIADADATCSAANCVAFGNNSASFTAEAGSLYYIVVDGFLGEEGDYTVEVSCGGGECGDGVLNAGEQCDDGGNDDEDGCDAFCFLEFCGDGFTQAGLGEECDDGDNIDGDGCSAECQDETEGCVVAFPLACGESDDWNNGDFGSTDQIDTYSCIVDAGQTGPEYTYEFVAAADGEVTAALTGMTADLDVFILEDLGDGSCDPANCLVFGDNETTTDTVAGRRYYVVVDGYLGAVSDFTLTLTCSTSGTCGDGVIDPGEECDDLLDPATCTGCLLDAGSCQADFELDCGGSDSWSTLGAGATDRVDEYACEDWDESGPEYTYVFEPAFDGTVEIALDPELGIDLDLFVLLDLEFGCVAGNCIASDDDFVSFEAFAGSTYYVVVDGFEGDAGSFFIDMSCPL